MITVKNSKATDNKGRIAYIRLKDGIYKDLKIEVYDMITKKVIR